MENESWQQTPEQDAVEHIFACTDKHFLEGRNIDSCKGRGLFTNKSIEPSMFVVEYRGKIYSIKTTTPKKACADSLVNYLYEFSWNGAQWCVDASSEDRTLGRLVNDDHINPSCEMRKIVCNGTPHLCLFAVRKISPGEEITFNYGNLSYPWRSTLEDSTAASDFENPMSDEDDDAKSRVCDNSSNSRSQLDLSEVSQEMSGNSKQQPGNTSCSKRKNKDPFSSDGPIPVRSHRSRKASQKSKHTVYATQNYCYFCGKGVSKLARHFLTHVKEHPDLAKADSLPKNSKERQRILTEFRNKGNYKHNQEVLRNDSGELKVSRRLKTEDVSLIAFLPCLFCKAMFKRKAMWRHARKCPERKTSGAATGGKTKILGNISLAEAPLAQKLTPVVRKLLSDMKQDGIAFAVKNDFLLIKLAEHLSDKYSGDPSKQELIREKLREMGRLLLALCEKSIVSFQDVIKPSHFYTVVKVVKKIAGFDMNRKRYKNPNVALSLGSSLRKICAIAAEVEDYNDKMKCNAEKFLYMCEKEWAELVSQPALTSLKGQKFNHLSTVPFTRDVQLLYRYLEFASANAIKALRKEASQHDYTALCRVTLTHVSVLNGCTPEVSKMTLEAFQERDESTKDLSRHFIKVNVESKTGQSTPVLLTSRLASALTLLVSMRSSCGVHKDNPFLFAKPDSSPTSLYYGRPSVRAFSILCCAKSPEHLRAVHFHKYMARVFQILSLENEELAHLAELLGHDFQADRDFYKLPMGTVDLAKIAKLVQAMEQGSLETMKGNSLQEFEIDDELAPEVDVDIDDIEEDDEESDPEERESKKQRFLDDQSTFSHEDSSQLLCSTVEDSDGLSSPAKSCGDDEYIPQVDTDISDSEEEQDAFSDESFTCSDNQENLEDKKDRASAARQSSVQRMVTRSGIQWEEDSDFCLFAKPKRSRRSINYCYICGKAQSKLSRHLFTHRHKEPEIAEVFGMRKNSAERHQRINELRNRGNLKHNEEVLRTGQGELKLKRKGPVLPPVMKECLFCKDMFTCKEIKKHMQSCPQKKTKDSPFCKSQVFTTVAYAEITDTPESSSEFDSILNSMKKDDISSAVLKDPFLILMGRYFCLLNKRNTRKSVNITSKLRVMGQLLLSLKKKLIPSFEEAMKPENFSKVVEALRELASFDEKSKTYNNRTFTVRLMDTLKTISVINYAKTMKECNDKQKTDEAETFVKLCMEEFSGIFKSKTTTPATPFIQDVQALFQHMEKTEASALESMTKYASAPVYAAFFKVIVAHLLIFNQNVDFSHVTLKSFQEREVAADVTSSQLEQILSKKSLKIKMMDNQDKKVVLTLTPELLAALELLVNKRDTCGIPADNPFLFAQPITSGGSKLGLFKGGICFTVTAAQSGAKDKVTLRSELYRKHLARVFQILSLTNDELDQLAKLLGWEIQTDREYYQKPEAVRDIAKILELLSAKENKALERFEGKSFEEIEIADELVAHVEPVHANKKDAEKNKEESETSFQMNEGSSSRRRAPSRFSRHFPSRRHVRGRGRGRGRRKESEDDGSELSDENTEEVITEHEDRSEGRPVRFSVSTPQRTPSPSNEDATNMLFGDDDDDDVDVDTDEDVPRFREKGHKNKTARLPNVKDKKKKDKADTKNTPQRTPSHSNEDTTNMLFGDDDGDDVDVDTDEDVPRFREKGNKNKTARLPNVKDKKKKDKADTKNTPQRTPSHSNEDATNMLFSDDDGDGDDMDMDTDEDMPRIKEKGDHNKNARLPNVKDKKKSDKADTKNTPQRTPSHSNEDATNMLFSDDDGDAMDMDMDMDMDTDEDRPRLKEKGDHDKNAWLPDVKDKKKNDKADKKKNDGSANTTEDIDSGPEDDTEEEDGEEEEKESDSRSSSPVVNKEKNNKIAAAMAGMKEVKIVIPKLDIAKLKAQVRLSTPAVNDQPVYAGNKQPQKSSTSTDADKNEPSTENEFQMICSHCKKKMMKGQTAFQKKGFTDVFCSRGCLFEMFPIHTPSTVKSCHYCSKSITQPLDLIMAAVDLKGTMKDFCSTSCLCSFKSNTEPSQGSQQVCNMCNAICSTKCGLTSKDVLYRFCSKHCLEDFRRENEAVCEKCSSSCIKPLIVSLEEEVVRLCSQQCLHGFKENNETPQKCTLCRVSRPLSDMVSHSSAEKIVELFCTHTCVISYKLQPENMLMLRVMKLTARVKRNNRDLQSDAEDGRIISDSGNIPPPISSDSRFCNLCGLELARGQKVCCFRRKSPLQSPAKHPQISIKKCYNCSEVISRPHNVILAPVDYSGAMKELCSNKCLASVNAKKPKAAPKPPTPPAQCKMCSKTCNSGSRLTLDDLKNTVCSDACFTVYHKNNNLSVVSCDICSAVTLYKRLTVKTEDGSKSFCSDKCLVEFKESIKNPQSCVMCQTLHQMSDMLENKNHEDMLDFFCSSQCMMVHKAQTFTVSGENTLLCEKEEVKEMELLPNLDFIKQEHIEEEYKPNMSDSVFTKIIKDEPTETEEELKTEEDPVLSSAGDPVSAEPTLTHMDVPASCSNCSRVLMDGETVYQRKSHTGIFCSSLCLSKFNQMKQVKKTCTFCLEVIKQSEKVMQAPVDEEGTMKDFCSHPCLSSFNYKRMTNTKVSIVPVASHSQCNMCSRYCISKHEIILKDVIHKICSDRCFLRLCNLNGLSVCVNCHSDCSTSLIFRMEDGGKKLCNAECLSQYKKKIQTPQPCAMCGTTFLISLMVESKNSEGELELFCKSSCVVGSKILALSGAPVNCDNCGKSVVPSCHFAMSDSSIRNFCGLSCAMTFKESHEDTNRAGASEQTQSDFLKLPERLLCVQCQHTIKTTPKVIQYEGKLQFACKTSCSQKFMRGNGILGKCEHCKNEKIIRDVVRVNDEDCYFCSDGCKVLFRRELKKQWGEHCVSCAFCLSISKAVMKKCYKNSDMEFCSFDCTLKYELLLNHLAKCDSCGRKGKLTQSLPLLGDVKYFCSTKCLLHFCNQQVQMSNPASSPSQTVSTDVSTPVIVNVISLADTLAEQSSISAGPAQRGSNTQTSFSFPDIHTKVVEHASVQTTPKELKNKSLLCTPLVHNKGVSCTTQTVHTETQTENIKPVVLPVPVPVYVPLPLNMYSQFTPQPLGLPLPLPVPLFLPGMSDSLHEAGKSTKEGIKTTSPEGCTDLSEMTDVQKETDKQTDRAATKEGLRDEIVISPDHSEIGTPEVDTDQGSPLNSQEDSLSHTSSGSLIQPSPVLETNKSCKRPAVVMTEDPQTSQSSAAAPLASQQTQDRVHNKNKGRKLQELFNADKVEAPREESSEAVSKELHKLRIESGRDAWERWMQWRTTQTNQGVVFTPALTLKEEILHCSATELSDGLCSFIREVKQPDGQPYSPDNLFYLCLSIQQHLLKNSRTENIFSDSIYNNFSAEITEILRGFKPSITASGLVDSCVKEEFLWESKQLGAYSPIVLLNTLLFFCCKYLGITTVEQHRQLSFAHVSRRRKTNPDFSKSRLLLFSPPKTIYKAATDKDGVPAKKRKRNRVTVMMENKENPLRCPVRFYEFYLSKCSESMRSHSNLFYLQPDQSCMPNSPVWFTSSPLDEHTMDTMLVRILAVRQMRGEDGGCSD